MLKVRIVNSFWHRARWLSDGLFKSAAGY